MGDMECGSAYRGNGRENSEEFPKTGQTTFSAEILTETSRGRGAMLRKIFIMLQIIYKFKFVLSLLL